MLRRPQSQLVSAQSKGSTLRAIVAASAAGRRRRQHGGEEDDGHSTSIADVHGRTAASRVVHGVRMLGGTVGPASRSCRWSDAGDHRARHGCPVRAGDVAAAAGGSAGGFGGPICGATGASTWRGRALPPGAAARLQHGVRGQVPMLCGSCRCRCRWVGRWVPLAPLGGAAFATLVIWACSPWRSHHGLGMPWVGVRCTAL